MGPLHSLLYEFPDLNKNIEDIGEEADVVYELLQQKIHLHQSFHYLNLQGKAAINWNRWSFPWNFRMLFSPLNHTTFQRSLDFSFLE